MYIKHFSASTYNVLFVFDRQARWDICLTGQMPQMPLFLSQALASLGSKSANADHLHYSASPLDARRELRLIFSQFQQGVQTTFLLVKPGALLRGLEDSVVASVRKEKFHITRRAKFQLVRSAG